MLEEFGDLARSAGASIAATITARLDRPNPSTLIGSGKLDEIKAAADASGADLILVNHALSPGQERNLERFLERRVIDRTGLILDIFAQRAHSHEGKLQVELAQLRHLATRLVRGWTHLERQRGGSIGLRGPGEPSWNRPPPAAEAGRTAAERLEKVEVQRTQMRRARVRSELPRVALVGYTNAGKSTLFSRTAAETPGKGGGAAHPDAPCARAQRTAARGPGGLHQRRQVDPVQRHDRCRGVCRRPAVRDAGPDRATHCGAGGQRGAGRYRRLVRDLPHDLVAAFRSTLSEAREADSCCTWSTPPIRIARSASPRSTRC